MTLPDSRFPRRVRQVLKSIWLTAWVVVSSLLLLEIALQIYNPLQVNVRGNRISLSANTTWTYSADPSSQLDSTILHRKNNIGFRGEDHDPGAAGFSIFTIGGSTTEETYITEGKTWSDRLRQLLGGNFRSIWLNNAGFLGHSTFAHQILLEDHIAKYRPDVLLFLVGINDVDRPGLDPRELTFWQPTLVWLADHSQVMSLALNLYRSFDAWRRGVTHYTGGLKEDWLVTWEISDAEKQAAVDYSRGLLNSYRDRLLKLVETSRNMGAEPILITQPVLYGNAIDDRTGLDLSRISVAHVDGKTAWTILEMYNDVARSLAREHDVFLVDLAVQLPKSSSYFYDTIHFTNEGSALIGNIIYRDICTHLAGNFQEYVTASCPARN